MTNLDTRAGLLAQIIAEPDDDLPRLLYADWLEEQGPYRWWCPQCDEAVSGTGLCPRCIATCYRRTVPDPERAEFIRGQCELATQGRMCTDMQGSIVVCGYCRHCTLRRRERELLAAHGRGWAFYALADACEFRRGFVELVEMRWSHAHLTALRAATPLRRCWLTTWPTFDPGFGYDEPTTRQRLAAAFPGVRFELPCEDVTARRPLAFR